MSTPSDKHPVYCFGEILWDVLPDGPLPGGAPFNVAYHLRRLNVPISMISRVGRDTDGEKLKALVRGWQVGDELLQTDPEQATSRVVATIGPGNEVSYEILFPVAWDFIEASKTALEKVRNAPYFIYGSLAARHAPSRKALFSLLEQAPYRVFDVNLRPPFFEKELLQDLLQQADLLKTNQSELEMLWKMFGSGSGTGSGSSGGTEDPGAAESGAGTESDTSGGTESVAAPESDIAGSLRDRFNIQGVIVTKGGLGASFYNGDGSWHAPGIPVTVEDTVGSGDSFLAAFIASHRKKEKPGECLRKAVAMGSFIAGKKGGCPEYELSDYLRFLDQHKNVPDQHNSAG